MTSDSPRLTRRQLLRSTSIALIGGLAGCSGQPGESSDPTTSTATATPHAQPSPTTESTSYVKTAPPSDTSTPTATPTATPAKSLSPSFVALSGTTQYGIELAGSPIIGQKNAPIDMYYWTDYQCSYCKQLELKTIPQLIRNEVANGTMRIVIQQMPLDGPHSTLAAVVAKSIWHTIKDSSPDTFWKWHHTVFKRQGLLNGEWSSQDSLLAYARKVGIDTGPVKQYMSAQRAQIKTDITSERKRGQKEGITNTPGTVLYRPATDRHIPLYGAQPSYVFHRQIQKLLK